MGRRVRPTHRGRGVSGAACMETGKGGRAAHQEWRLVVDDIYGLKKLRFVSHGPRVGGTARGKVTTVKSGGWRGWRQAELVVEEEVEL